MNDGSLLKLTIGKWYTPKDYSIDQNGILPDIEVEFLREDFDNKYDRQLDVAKKVLQEFVENKTIPLSVESYIKSIEDQIVNEQTENIQE